MLTYNGRDLLARCLASIDRHRPEPAHLPIEVVVVDNGSSDGTFEWLGSAYPAVRVVRIQNTLRLTEVEVSEALLGDVAKRDDLAQVSGPAPLAFDAGGALVPF